MYSKNWNCVYEKEQKKRVIPINGLCAYCMGKIAPKYGSMKIEHYKALPENKELALEYQNYLGVCYGGEKDVGTKPHILCCDAARKEQKLTVNSWDKKQMEAAGYKKEERTGKTQGFCQFFLSLLLV